MLHQLAYPTQKTFLRYLFKTTPTLKCKKKMRHDHDITRDLFEVQSKHKLKFNLKTDRHSFSS